MGLAFCHTLPRSRVARAAAFFVVVAFVLTVVGLSTSVNAAPPTRGHRWATIDVTLTINGQQRKETVSATGWWLYNADGEMLCRPKPRPGNFAENEACDDVVLAGAVAGVLYVVSAFLLFVLAPVVMCCVVPRTNHNLRMLFRYAACIACPTLLHCAASVGYPAIVLTRAKTFLRTFAGPAVAAPTGASILVPGSTAAVAATVDSVEFGHLGVAYNCLLAASFFLLAATVMSFAVLAWWRVHFGAEKEDIEGRVARHEPIDGEPVTPAAAGSHLYDVERRIQSRLVNDDAQRQQDVFQQRQRVVRAAILAKMEAQEEVSAEEAAKVVAREEEAARKKKSTAAVAKVAAATTSGKSKHRREHSSPELQPEYSTREPGAATAVVMPQLDVDGEY